MITPDSLPQECLITILKFLPLQDWITLSCVSKFFHEITLDDQLWHALAMEMFGHHVDKLANRDTITTNGGWKSYCTRRLNSHSTSKQEISPFNLIQESYARDPWTQIACCILCSRTTGGDAVRDAINTILTTWNTPSSILDASEEELMNAINPLGLQAVRYNALKSMSKDFLQKEWELPSEFKGCGKFASDSYLIFCRGLRNVNDVDDYNLQRYLRWLTKEESDDGGKEGKRVVVGGKKRKSEKKLDGVAGGKKERKIDRDARHAVRTGVRRATRSMTKNS